MEGPSSVPSSLEYEKISEVVDELTKDGRPLSEVLEYLWQQERSARLHRNRKVSSEVLARMIQVTSKNSLMLVDVAKTLSNKRGQPIDAICRMIKEMLLVYEGIVDEADGMMILEAIRNISSGKIYLEREYSDVTKALSWKKKERGELEEAAKLLFELKVETFGTLPPTERLIFLLDQLSLAIDTKDHINISALSSKIKSIGIGEARLDVKLRYFYMMMEAEECLCRYVGCGKYNLKIFEEEEDMEKKALAFKNAIGYALLSDVGPERRDILDRATKYEVSGSMKMYKDFARLFVSNNFIRWSDIFQVYSLDLCYLECFSRDPQSRFNILKAGVLDHNILVVSSHYSRISLNRFAILLGQENVEDAEVLFVKAVEKAAIKAKLDRSSKIIEFGDVNKNIMDSWTKGISSLLDATSKTCGLIFIDSRPSPSSH